MPADQPPSGGKQAPSAEAQAFYDELGPRGMQKAGQAWTRLVRLFGKDEAARMEQDVATKADFTRLEGVMDQADHEKQLGRKLGPVEAKEFHLKRLQASVAYQRGDPAVVQQVRDGWKALYPGCRKVAAGVRSD
jgi:hypothetical protein